MPSISQQSLRPEAVTDRSAATMAVVGVGNPKERRPEYLCALEALRLHTQNAAAREIISPRHSAGNRKVMPTEQTQLYVAGFANRRAAWTPADSSGVFRPNSESMRRGSKLRFANFSWAVRTHHVLFALNHLECAHLHRIILFAECCAPCAPNSNRITCITCAKQSATGCPKGPAPWPSCRHTVDRPGAQVFLLPLRLLADKSHPHFPRRRK